MKNEQWLYDYKDMVQRIAAEFRRRYSMVETTDIQQEMYLWFVSHPRKFKEWLDLPERERDRLIAKSLRNTALKYCEKEKARQGRYDLSDLYYYDASVIEAFLPSIINESYEMPTKIQDLNAKFGKSEGEVNDGMNWVTLRADIAGAYYKLSEAKQNILRLAFTQEQGDWKTLAIELETTPDGARMKVQRTIASLIQFLGGWKPYNDEETIEQGFVQEIHQGSTDSEDN